MRRTLPMLLLVLTITACGSAAPRSYRVDSPASPAAKPAARLPVASVLVAKDPLEAAVCAPGAPCVLPDAMGPKPAAPSTHEGHGGHHHHH